MKSEALCGSVKSGNDRELGQGCQVSRYSLPSHTRNRGLNYSSFSHCGCLTNFRLKNGGRL
jgi:hypothetical protein